jgi:hypothetical protein
LVSEHGANPGNLLVATFGALLVATLLLVTVVLPAEYGIDPLGSGKALGLLGLANPEGTALSESTDAVYVRHQVSFDLAPFESVEFKYRLGRGAGMVYSWLASGPLTVDFHAEPDDAPDGFAESFRRGRFHSGNGTYTASFSGIHGWFWENRTMNVVRLDLRSAGFFSQTVKFRDGARVDASLPLPQ